MVVFVATAATSTATVVGSKILVLLGDCASVVRAILVAGITSFFLGGSFLGGLVELTSELSSSSSYSEIVQKVLVLVGSSSRNG